MYLSRFTIDTQRRGARTLLSSRRRIHAAIESAVDGGRGQPHSSDTRVLWRVDGLTTASPVVYVVSPTEPSRPYLADGEDRVATGEVTTRPYEPLVRRLEVGQRWTFRLAANPVQNLRKEKGDRRSKRYGHVTAQQQRDWLLSRADKAGFMIPTATTGEPDVLVHDRSTVSLQRNGHTVTLRVAAYDGVLEVTDPELLGRTLIRGLGHAKAYGCGLLTLAPPP